MDALDLYLEYTKPFKGSPRYHTWAFISVLAATLERRVWSTWVGGQKIYPNMYITLCGGPGTGKTMSADIATKLLRDYNNSLGKDSQGIRFGPDKMTPAALLKRFQKCTKTSHTPFGKFEHSSMYLYSSELSTMIKDIGGGAMSDDLLKLYDCDDVFEKELVGQGNITIKAPCLNLLAATTPAFLGGFLPKEESGTGLTARIIFANELGKVQKAYDAPEGDPGMRLALIDHIKRIHRMSGPFRASEDAEAYFTEFWKKTDEALDLMPQGSFLSYFYARKPIHIKKLSMIVSSGDNSSRLIETRHVERAIELVNEAEPFMDKVFGVKDFRRQADASKTIADAIPWAPQEISQPELLQSLYYGGSFGELQHFENLLSLLVSGRLISRRVGKDNVIYYARLR